ncbi:hypothetical protein Anapl_06031 [Anas platyrhynchos]|uniref:Uncharacterized protein n=1 Tax=Anas platyrhynchos TaxID=8839 RepID=R0LVB4_ANAPL|nr:hypothetical protein Anapl_06031 [Anas platyrhynchos]
MLLTVQCVSIPDLFQPGACSLWYRDSGILVDSKHCFPDAGFILFCSSFAKKVGSIEKLNQQLSPQRYSYYVKEPYSQETAQPATASTAFSLVRGHLLTEQQVLSWLA